LPIEGDCQYCEKDTDERTSEDDASYFSGLCIRYRVWAGFCQSGSNLLNYSIDFDSTQTILDRYAV